VDQGNVRTELAIFEKDKQTFNPLSNWSWQDITDFVTLTQLPYNRKHDIIYRSETPIPATQRHLPGLPWKAINLGKPYWTATQSELQGFPAAKYVYVWKSFGDHHTSVPVHAEESERSGRFVRNVGKTECGIHTRSTSKGQPHGGVLVDLMEKDTEKRASLIASCENRVIELDERGACDVELLINGGFSPLRGFMTEHEYNHVVQHMRLPELQLFAMPIVLHTNSESLKVGQNVLLKFKDDLGGESRPLAVLTIQSKWIPNKPLEAQKVLGTTRYDHPGVQEITERGKYYLGGRIFGLDFPRRVIECKTPRDLRSEFSEQKDVVAFQCRNPVHRAHYELFSRVPSQIDNSVVLVHPTCGPTQDGDIDWRLRFKTYEALQKYVPNPSIKWAYLPYSMKMAGPREAIQHMIIRKNYGATHFIIGRDMAGCKSTISGEDFYGPYDAQQFAEKHEAELGIKVVPFKQLVFTKEKGYIEKEEADKLKIKSLSLSGTEFRKRLKTGEEIPEWFAFPAVVKVLRESAVAEE
jgi:sulfate adenylyltransferase